MFYIKPLSIQVLLKSWLRWTFGSFIVAQSSWTWTLRSSSYLQDHSPPGGGLASSYTRGSKTRALREGPSWAPPLQAHRAASCQAHRWLPPAWGMVAWEAVRPVGGAFRGCTERSATHNHRVPPLWCGADGCTVLLSQQGAATDEDRHLNNSGDSNTWEEQPQKRADFLLNWDVEVQSGDLSIKVNGT